MTLERRPDDVRIIGVGLSAKPTECNKCSLLLELFDATDKSPRLYWVMTELFVLLHGGKDECRG